MAPKGWICCFPHAKTDPRTGPGAQKKQKQALLIFLLGICPKLVFHIDFHRGILLKMYLKIRKETETAG